MPVARCPYCIDHVIFENEAALVAHIKKWHRSVNQYHRRRYPGGYTAL